MNFIKNTLVYLLLLVFDVKTIVNKTDKLENCVTKVGASLTDTDENRNLLKLIDQSTVILKAFCSENLINFVEESDDELEVNEESKTSSEKNDFNDVDSDNDEYSDYYFYKSNEDKNVKTLMTFTPITTYKGQLDLRQLESFNNQEFFLIQGQLNATLELDKEHKILYHKKCFNNPEINDQGKMLNENHLIEKQVRYLLPGQLIIFGKLDNNNGQSKNSFAVKTSAMIRWNSHVENFIWNNLGWSSWGKWSPCSKSCKGIQQRYRHCLTNQQNNTNSEMATNEKEANEMEKSETTRQPNQQLCNGYNIEQRECNLFECEVAVNLLSLNNTKTGLEATSAHINQVVDKNNFTIMLTIGSKVTKPFPFDEDFWLNQHVMSLRSNNKQSSLTISLIENGIKVVQEKDATSEMFAVKLNLFDLHWHQIAFSFHSDGLTCVICYVDCNWTNSFVMSKGSFEVPPNTRVELNPKLNGLIEWKQLNLISGNHERSQCSNERTPIYDKNIKMLIDEAN